MKPKDVKVEETGMYYRGKYYKIKARIVKVEKL